MSAPSLAVAELILRAHVTETQAALDVAAIQARAVFVRALRDAMVENPADATQLEVFRALANSVAVGRDSDNYPEVRLTDEARAYIRRAAAAGVLRETNQGVHVGSVVYYSDLSGVADLGSASGAKSADYEAWAAARDYRAKTAG